MSFCVWLTGLSGAGKSTTAERVTRMLAESGTPAALLDGDAVRRQFSAGLGFTRNDRDTNVRRIAAAAKSMIQGGQPVVVACISPYRATREEVRATVGPTFVEVFVDTPLAVCEQRDPKGLYAKARRGELSGFTGVDDPYEPPLAAEIVLDTVARDADDNARAIVDYLRARGWLGK